MLVFKYRQNSIHCMPLSSHSGKHQQRVRIIAGLPPSRNSRNRVLVENYLAGSDTFRISATSPHRPKLESLVVGVNRMIVDVGA